MRSRSHCDFETSNGAFSGSSIVTLPGIYVALGWIRYRATFHETHTFKTDKRLSRIECCWERETLIGAATGTELRYQLIEQSIEQFSEAQLSATNTIELITF